MKVLQLRREERGSAAVEFALVLPVLLMIIFGIVDFGRMLTAKITLTEAAREGARATALVNADTARARVADATLSLDSAVTTNITECPVPATVDDDATVEVRYDFTFVTPLGLLVGIGGDGVVTLTATGVMPCLA